jgi:hypothetical protein
VSYEVQPTRNLQKVKRRCKKKSEGSKVCNITFKILSNVCCHVSKMLTTIGYVSRNLPAKTALAISVFGSTVIEEASAVTLGYKQ